jgi:protein-S-isoprenylcysteine O-methyltransferase Ste14
MFDQQSIDIFLEKVPDLRNPWKALLTVAYVLVLSAICGLFFYYVDRLTPYAALISQLVMALLVTLIGYLHFQKAEVYRQRYGALAYRYFFYHFMVPYLVTWYACFFHPLFVDGPALLPRPLALGLGGLCLALMVLVAVHIERAGFHEVTHGMDIYTVFPEETTVVHGEIYGYIRHPLYFALMCGSIGLALFSNNAFALGVALLQLIPAVAVGYMEDQELIERAGEEHLQYIKTTNLLVPTRRIWVFLKMLAFLRK